MKRICVFCGSSPGNNSKYTKSARKLGETLTEGDITLIYGGSNIGLMGEIANAMVILAFYWYFTGGWEHE